MGGTGRGTRALVLGLAALVLVGCAGSPAPARPQLPRHGSLTELVSAVAERQRIDRTARISLRGELAGAAITMKFTGEGVLRGVGSDVAVKFTQVVTRPDADPQETGFVVLPDALYLLQPGRHTAARPWTRVDRSSTDPEDQQLLAQAATLIDSADPARTISRYAGATSITETAEDVIAGDPAVRYTLVVDLARAAALQPDPAVRAQLLQQVRSGLTQITSNLWIDQLSRPVRLVVRQELPGIGTLSIMGSYRDWGRDVEIEAPPGSQVR